MNKSDLASGFYVMRSLWDDLVQRLIRKVEEVIDRLQTIPSISTLICLSAQIAVGKWYTRMRENKLHDNSSLKGSFFQIVTLSMPWSIIIIQQLTDINCNRASTRYFNKTHQLSVGHSQNYFRSFASSRRSWSRFVPCEEGVLSGVQSAADRWWHCDCARYWRIPHLQWSQTDGWSLFQVLRHSEMLSFHSWRATFISSQQRWGVPEKERVDKRGRRCRFDPRNCSRNVPENRKLQA